MLLILAHWIKQHLEHIVNLNNHPELESSNSSEDLDCPLHSTAMSSLVVDEENWMSLIRKGDLNGVKSAVESCPALLKYASKVSHCHYHIKFHVLYSHGIKKHCVIRKME